MLTLSAGCGIELDDHDLTLRRQIQLYSRFSRQKAVFIMNHLPSKQDSASDGMAEPLEQTKKVSLRERLRQYAHTEYTH